MTLRGILVVMVAALCVAAWATTCVSWRFRELAEGVAWLEPREFDVLTVITVGTGTIYENPNRLGPATAVAIGKRVVLVDAGRALGEALRAATIPLTQPDTVFLTNLLPENTVGLDDLLLTAWLIPRDQPLRVVGPPGTVALTQGLLAAHRRGIEARGRSLDLPAEGATLEALEVGDGWSAASGELRVSAAALGGGPIEALAYRFDTDGGSVVVSATGWDQERVAELARGADGWVQDAFWLASLDRAIKAGADDPERMRREAEQLTSLEEVGGLARSAGVGTLILTRLRPPPLYSFMFSRIVGESFDGDIVVAGDGDEIRLGSPVPRAAAAREGPG